MPWGLKRFQQSRQTHFVTFTCYHRRRGFDSPALCDRFLQVLESMRQRFAMCVYGYVVMPEHVHLLLSEPERGLLADAIHYLKLSFAKRRVAQVRVRSLDANLGPFWQKRYYDRNVRDEHEFKVKLRYLHRNPVKRGLVIEPAEWKWSSFRHYALRETGVVEIESAWTASERGQQATRRSGRIFLSPGWRPKNGREPGPPVPGATSAPTPTTNPGPCASTPRNGRSKSGESQRSRSSQSEEKCPALSQRTRKNGAPQET